MKLNDIKAPAGATHNTQRKGRGDGSGRGKTSGRGTKGQMARSGSRRRWGFEGGQTPLFRRLQKRGFNNKNFETKYVEVPVSRLNVFADGDVVDLAAIKDNGVAKFDHKQDKLKIIGNEQLDKKLTVKASKFTKSAKASIEAAGGVAEEV